MQILTQISTTACTSLTQFRQQNHHKITVILGIDTLKRNQFHVEGLTLKNSVMFTLAGEAGTELKGKQIWPTNIVFFFMPICKTGFYLTCGQIYYQ